MSYSSKVVNEKMIKKNESPPSPIEKYLSVITSVFIARLFVFAMSVGLCVRAAANEEGIKERKV